MRVFVRAAAPVDHAWIGARIGLEPASDFRAIAAFDEATRRIVGMVGYDWWTENACCIHVAVESPIALRHLLRPGFGVPFVELGIGVVIARVAATNARSLALVQHLGFREVYRGKDWLRKGEDVVLLELRKEDCRWVA